MNQLNVDLVVKHQLDQFAVELENILGADLLCMNGPIVYGLDIQLRQYLENFTERKTKLAIILETPGGVVEVVERMVDTIRYFYTEVVFIVPDRAMSAGTVFVMSGDEIMMDYFSVLGPIDPQIVKDGRLIPALSYIIQYERMIEKAKTGELTNADLVLLSKLDLAELHQYEQARELSVTLLRKWLATYKFKNWEKTESSKTLVTKSMREERAAEVARILNDNQFWHSHNRGIGIDSIKDKLNLRIDNLAENKLLVPILRKYVTLITDYMARQNYVRFIHTCHYC